MGMPFSPPGLPPGLPPAPGLPPGFGQMPGMPPMPPMGRGSAPAFPPPPQFAPPGFPMPPMPGQWGAAPPPWQMPPQFQQFKPPQPPQFQQFGPPPGNYFLIIIISLGLYHNFIFKRKKTFSIPIQECLLKHHRACNHRPLVCLPHRELLRSIQLEWLKCKPVVLCNKFSI